MTVFANATLGIPASWDACIGVSLIISTLGSMIINPFVIVFHARKRSSEAKLLFILLGLSDFITLFGTPIINAESFLRPSPDFISENITWYKTYATWNTEITVQYSAFLTSVMSLTRCISIMHPFYEVNIALLRACVVSWFLYLVGFRIVAKYLEAEHYGCEFVWDPFAQLVVPHINCAAIGKPSYKMMYVINATVLQRGIWIIISLFSLIFTISKLHRRPGRTAKRSEVTVVILTTAYLLAFIPMIIENVLWLSDSYMLADNGYYLYYIMVAYPGQLLSAINPIIIIIRSRELQRYLRRCITHPFSKTRSGTGDNTASALNVPNPKDLYRLTNPNPNVRKRSGVSKFVARARASIKRTELRLTPIVEVNPRPDSLSPPVITGTGTSSGGRYTTGIAVAVDYSVPTTPVVSRLHAKRETVVEAIDSVVSTPVDNDSPSVDNGTFPTIINHMDNGISSPTIIEPVHNGIGVPSTIIEQTDNGIISPKIIDNGNGITPDNE